MKQLKNILEEFGLNKNEVKIYEALSQHQWKTALEISRLTNIKRTSLYRNLEDLLKEGLIRQQVDDKTTYFNIANPNQFKKLVNEARGRAESLSNAFADLLQSIPEEPTDKASTTVRFHRGQRALEGMEWQMTRIPNSQLLIFGCDQWAGALGKDFAEQIREEMVKNNILSRELLNEDQAESIPESGKVSWTNNTTYVKEYFQHRVISKDILDIQNEIYILPSYVYFHSFQNQEYVGIEIISQSYTNLMKQLFELTWNQAKSIDSFA